MATAVVESTIVNLSQAGLGLILLEQELENNLKELRRWRARQQEADQKVIETRERLAATQKRIEAIKQSF